MSNFTGKQYRAIAVIDTQVEISQRYVRILIWIFFKAIWDIMFRAEDSRTFFIDWRMKRLFIVIENGVTLQIAPLNFFAKQIES